MDHGVRMPIRTVSGPVTKIDLTGTSKGPATGDSCCASRFVFTAAASSGVPSWNTMLARSVIVHSVKSLLWSIDLANSGSSSWESL